MKFKILLFLILILCSFILVNYFNNYNYKTQQLIFINKQNPQITIEEQWKDLGALGYDKRIVKINKILFVKNYTELDTNKLIKNEWKRVNIYLNKLGLKGG